MCGLTGHKRNSLVDGVKEQSYLAILCNLQQLASCSCSRLGVLPSLPYTFDNINAERHGTFPVSVFPPSQLIIRKTAISVF